MTGFKVYFQSPDGIENGVTRCAERVSIISTNKFIVSLSFRYCEPALAVLFAEGNGSHDRGRPGRDHRFSILYILLILSKMVLRLRFLPVLC